jgi:hypothetical protein
MGEVFRIGTGAGFANDRIDAAVTLAERVDLDVMVLECLGERTIAFAQRKRRHDPEHGYDALLERRMKALLPIFARKGTRLVSNMGAANPLGAAKAVLKVAAELGLKVKVAAVTGDDVLDRLDPDMTVMETGAPLSTVPDIISANAYLGADALQEALGSDAQVIVAGRIADPSLFLAPLVHRFGWRADDAQRIGQGLVAGHLLECAGQLTGGYFAEPGIKDVAGMADLGFPFAEIDEAGGIRLGTPPRTGGAITLATCKEQLFYEVMDPTAYLTPDAAVDFTGVSFRQDGDRMVVSGGRTTGRPATLKVSVGHQAGYIGEGEISYAGPNALARARMAGEIVRTRLGREGMSDLRVDLVGLDAAHRRFYGNAPDPYDVRLRVAGRGADFAAAERVGEEVEALFTNGPGGGGGVRRSTREVIAIVSVLMPRERVRPETHYFS